MRVERVPHLELRGIVLAPPIRQNRLAGVLRLDSQVGEAKSFKQSERLPADRTRIRSRAKATYLDGSAQWTIPLGWMHFEVAQASAIYGANDECDGVHSLSK